MMARPVSRQAVRQRGYSLLEIALVLLLSTLAVIALAAEAKRQLDDSAAESTGKYLLTMRDAVVALQIKQEAWLDGVDVSGAPAGTYPPAPNLPWVTVDGAQIARGGVSDLIDLNLLSANFPPFPALGDLARFILVREGACPGETCRTSAFVYLCHPVSAARSLRTSTTCTVPTGSRAEASANLLGQVILSAGGYGGHDPIGSTRVRGALFDVPASWFGFSGPARGHAVVAAGLGVTPFGEFVRHGETRPVKLNNTLEVQGQIQSNTGLVLNTAVVPGTPCAVQGMYASTAAPTLAVCMNGSWFSMSGQVVTDVLSDLANDSAVPPLNCPPGMVPWRHLAMQSTDVTVTGSDINIGGDVGGNISGSGSVNAAGAVTISGSFAGSFLNSGSSSVRVGQQVSVVGDRIVITPSDSNARASLIQGCKG